MDYLQKFQGERQEAMYNSAPTPVLVKRCLNNLLQPLGKSERVLVFSNFDGQVSYQPLDEVSNMIRGCKTGNFWKNEVLVYANWLMIDTAAGLERQTWEHYMWIFP